MKSTVSVSYQNDRVEFTGDVDALGKPKIFHWFRTNFKIDQRSPSELVLQDERFQDRQFLFEFKNSLQRLLVSIEINFDSAFTSVIVQEERELANFQEFSQNALKIWENKYDVEEFETFCNVVYDRLCQRRLYRLQLLSAYHMAFSQHACNFSVPGAGKTSIVFSSYAFLNSLDEFDDKFVNRLLIIGPPSSFDPWEQEYLECFGRVPQSIRISGETPSTIKREVLKGVVSNDYDLFLVTYQSVPTLLEELKIFLKAQSNRVMLVCDEAHKFKSLEGVWADSILQLAKWAKSRIVLTGTPAPNGYEDLYNIFKFLYPERNVTQFRPDFLRGLTHNPVQSTVDELVDNIRPYFVRIKKADLSLPAYVDHPLIYNHLSDLESEVYDRLEAAMANSDSDVNRQSLHFRLIQCCNNLFLLNKPLSSFEEESFGVFKSGIALEGILGATLSQRIKDLDETYIPSKHAMVKDLVLGIKSKKGKVILWGIFIDSIRRLKRYLELQGLKGAYIVGETKKGGGDSQDDLTREDIIRRFKNGELDFLIANPMVLGESVSLHKICHNAIYFEQWYTAAPYVQSRDRIHRVWLDQNLNQVDYETNYYHIVSNKAADTGIHNRVQAKFRRMVEIIERDIPFFTEDMENDRTLLIQNIIDEYRSREI